MTGLLFIVSCTTETPVEESAVVEAPPVVKDDESVDLTEAITAMQRAEEVEAPRLASDEWETAKALFNEAQNALNADDMKLTKSKKAATIVAANKAYDAAIEALIREYLANLDTLERLNRDIESPAFFPTTFTDGMKLSDTARTLLTVDTFIDGKRAYWEASQALQGLYDLTDENIRWINILQRDIDLYLGDAEKVDSFLWAKDEVDSVMTHYYDGLNFYQDYDFANSEKDLLQARFLAKGLVNLSTERQQLAALDSMMDLVADGITSASEVRSFDGTTGTVIEAAPISKTELYDSVEVVSSDELAAPEVYQEEESKLTLPMMDDMNMMSAPMEETTPTVTPQPNNDLSFSIFESGVLVLGEEDTVNLLDEAKSYWENGVEARNDKNFKLAEEYFVQAQIYLSEYKNNSVNNAHEVISGDSLWRIAGQTLNEPFLWPQVWRSNRNQIANPDLIFPGQIFIIPNEADAETESATLDSTMINPPLNADNMNKNNISSDVNTDDMSSDNSTEIITDPTL